MLRAFYASKEWATWAYGGLALLISSLWIQVQLTVAINSWYGGFYDHLQIAAEFSENPQEGIDIFYDFLISTDFLFNGFEGNPSFLVIAMPYVLLATFTAWFTRIYGLRWRQAITFNYIPRWQNVEEEIEGASQRIQEDCNRFARIVESLGLQVVRAIMTLVAFVPVLWALSDSVTIPFFSDIQGSLVWTALSVSIGGLIISWFVGYRLPGLEYNNQNLINELNKKNINKNNKFIKDHNYSVNHKVKEVESVSGILNKYYGNTGLNMKIIEISLPLIFVSFCSDKVNRFSSLNLM